MDKTFRLREDDEFIKLGQLLKAADLVSMGSEAKDVIAAGLVTVNGEEELRRGRKITDGDTVVYRGSTVRVTR